MAEYTRHSLPPGGRLSERIFSPSIIHQMIQKVHTQNRKRFPLPQVSWLPLCPGSPPDHLSQWERQGSCLKQKSREGFLLPGFGAWEFMVLSIYSHLLVRYICLMANSIYCFAIRYDINPSYPAGYIGCIAHIEPKAYRKSRKGFMSI